MEAPQNDCRIADAHVHFFSRRFLDSLGAQAGKTAGQIAETLGWALPPEDPAELGRVWAAELSRHGVARGSLIASVPGDESSVAAALAACLSGPRAYKACFSALPRPGAERTAARSR